MNLKAPRQRGLLVLIAALLCVAVAARLGVWQLGRAAQKAALQAAQDSRARLPAVDVQSLARTPEQAAAQHYRPVRLVGHWVSERSVFLENRPMQGRVGFFVVTPLRLVGDKDAVLVQRGWAPRDIRERTLLPEVPSTTDVVEVTGIIAPPPARLYEFAAPGSGSIRQNLELEAFSRETGLPLLPLSILQSDSPSAAGDGLLRRWPPPAIDIHKHYGYAFQWFALGALMAGLYVWFQLVRPRLRRHA